MAPLQAETRKKPDALTPRARVDINGRFLTQRVTGVQRYARETLLALDELIAAEGNAGIEWRVLVPKGAVAPALRTLPVVPVGFLRGHAWEQLELPAYSAGRLLLGFGFTGPLIKRNQIITVHDAAVVRHPENFHWLFRHAYHLSVRYTGQRAAAVLTVSEFSRKEAIECFGIPAELLHLTGEGWQHMLRVEADSRILDRNRLRDKPFILAVSSPTRSKNLHVLGEALRLMGAEAPLCVVAGIADAAIFHTLPMPSSQTLSLGYVTDCELKALFESAQCLIFPSLYEGFGLPPLEAMACGCSVLCADIPALRETYTGTAEFFNPTSNRDLAAVLSRTLAARKANSAQAEIFRKPLSAQSWAQTAERIRNAVLQLLYPGQCKA